MSYQSDNQIFRFCRFRFNGLPDITLSQHTISETMPTPRDGMMRVKVVNGMKMIIAHLYSSRLDQAGQLHVTIEPTEQGLFAKIHEGSFDVVHIHHTAIATQS